jgi:hypothetical protein
MKRVAVQSPCALGHHGEAWYYSLSVHVRGHPHRTLTRLIIIALFRKKRGQKNADPDAGSRQQ